MAGNVYGSDMPWVVKTSFCQSCIKTWIMGCGTMGLPCLYPKQCHISWVVCVFIFLVCYLLYYHWTCFILYQTRVDHAALLLIILLKNTVVMMSEVVMSKKKFSDLLT